MAKVDIKGRSKGDRFVQLPFHLLRSAAYADLSAPAKALLLEFPLLYNGTNNGDIAISLRDAADRLNFANHYTVSKYFKELELAGFIKVRVKGSFGRKVQHATEWIMTWQPYRGNPPTKEFMRKQVRTRGRKPSQLGSKNKLSGTKIATGEWPDGCSL